MTDERPALITVPTELDRGDAYIDLSVCIGTGLACWYLVVLQHVPPLWLIPIILPVAVWTLTGEPLADVRGVGAIASGLRSKLGLRRAHEWLLAYGHYFQVRTWPDWRAWRASSPSKPVVAGPITFGSSACIATIELWPTTNYALASTTERSDEMDALSRVLMGLSHPIQLIGQSHAAPVQAGQGWPRPPQTERRWLAVVTADEREQLAWRVRTLRSALEGIGLRTALSVEALPGQPYAERHGVRAGDQHHATLVLRRWPREVGPGWLGQALAGDLPVDVSIHIQPQDPQSIARRLKSQQTWQDDGGKDVGNALGFRDAETTRQKLIARTDRPVKVAIALTVTAPSPAELRRRLDTLKHEIGLALGDARPATFEHDRGLEACLPLGRCAIVGAWRTLDCMSVASTWLFQPATVRHHSGADLGTTRNGSMLVRLDPFDPSLRSFGGLITGSVGSGKSYLLKLLLRRLDGVEKLIVEHSDPPEYDGVPGLKTYSVADLSEAEQAVRLRAYITDLWATARSDPRPRLLVLDELWSIIKRPELAMLVEEVARRGRKYGLALWIATQQIEELLDTGKAVFDNAAVRVYLQQESRDLQGLTKAAHLSDPARQALRGAGRGQALLQVGSMLVLMDVQAGASEHMLVTTDPREVWGLTAASAGERMHSDGPEHAGLVAVPDGACGPAADAVGPEGRVVAARGHAVRPAGATTRE